MFRCQDQTPADDVINLMHERATGATVKAVGGRYFGFVTGGVLPVALAARWLSRLNPNEREPDQSTPSDLGDYLAAVPFPLGPARAKGRRFEVAPRRRAGLSEEMIQHVRLARSTQEQGIASGPPKTADPKTRDPEQPEG